jgi:16S rRNA (cytosine1402-N4)-methyltransferase
MKTDTYHTPVLLDEAIEYLRIEPGKKYIDATLGGGGHTKAILKRGGLVLGIDVDQDALDFVSENQKLILAKGNFKDIDEIAHLKGFDKAWGIIFDLGVSSHQIDTPSRGFSFLNDASLDMRMDKDLGVKAADLLKVLTKGELYEIFNNLGQERNAWLIAGAIVRARGVEQIKTTSDLVRVIASVYGIEKDIPDFRKNELCKRVFQALRIAVNSELENLKEGLRKSIGVLGSGGRIVVISFHSLEDKIVKEQFRQFEEKNMGTILTQKPIVPKAAEAKVNPRSSSAKLRAFEKN